MPATTLAAPHLRPYDGMRMDLAEFEALDLDAVKPYLEWWDGVVIQKAVPNDEHSRTQTRFGHFLLLYEWSAGGVASTENHVWFEQRGYRVPDVAFWISGAPRKSKGRSLPPSLVVEVCSPGQKVELRTKCREMRALGVDVCWLADPATRTVEVFDDANDGTLLREGESLTSPLLPGFSLAVGDAFPPR